MKALSRVKNAPKPGDHVTEEQVKAAIEKVKKEKQYQWHEKSICSYQCEIKTGKIVGQLFRTNFSDDIYHATVNGDNVGEYISEKCARTAIEKQIEKNEQDMKSFNLEYSV